jgi:hydroxymethylglutaryl-CoA lyase
MEGALTMTALPNRVQICEEGPREGFQSLPPVPTAQKVRLIEALAETGLSQINCASFVNPKLVPSMADSEAVAAAIRRRPGVRYIGLWLSETGFRRALATQLDIATTVLCCTTDSMARANNGCSAAELLRRQGALVDLCREHGLPLEMAHVSTAFGCSMEGHVPADRTVSTIAALLSICDDHGLHPQVVYLSDTVGAGTPAGVIELLDKARSRWPEQEFGLHLHDTRGMGLANAYAGLQMGVTRFDASIGGMGGCPFSGSKGAAGNVCTEDLALMCEEMGIDTGVNLEALFACGDLAEEIAGRPLPGKARRAGRLRASVAVQ